MPSLPLQINPIHAHHMTKMFGTKKRFWEVSNLQKEIKYVTFAKALQGNGVAISTFNLINTAYDDHIKKNKERLKRGFTESDLYYLHCLVSELMVVC